jgi:hypothetical protein
MRKRDHQQQQKKEHRMFHGSSLSGVLHIQVNPLIPYLNKGRRVASQLKAIPANQH